jgi:hypothetical protein
MSSSSGVTGKSASAGLGTRPDASGGGEDVRAPSRSAGRSGGRQARHRTDVRDVIRKDYVPTAGRRSVGRCRHPFGAAARLHPVARLAPRGARCGQHGAQCLEGGRHRCDLVLELALAGIGDDLEELGDVGQVGCATVRVTGIDPIVRLPDGPGQSLCPNSYAAGALVSVWKCRGFEPRLPLHCLAFVLGMGSMSCAPGLSGPAGSRGWKHGRSGARLHRSTPRPSPPPGTSRRTRSRWARPTSKVPGSRVPPWSWPIAPGPCTQGHAGRSSRR